MGGNFFKQMKVLIITEEIPTTMGGGTTFLTFFTKGLRYYGIDYEVLAPQEHNSFKNFFIRNLINKIIYLRWQINVMAYLENNEKWKEFDLINVHEFVYSGELAMKIKEKYGIPIVLTSHGIYTEGLKERKVNKFVISQCKRQEKKVCQNADYIIGINRNVAEYYKKFNKNVTFIPNFIDTSMFKPIERQGIKTIAWIGRLSREKNVGRICDIAKDNPDKNFLIVGDGEEFEKIKANSPDNVIFAGRIDYNDIPEIHKKIDLLFNFCEVEPFGLNVLEGMASGIPAITYDVNEFHYFVGGSGAGEVIPLDAELNSAFNISLNQIENDYENYSSKAVETAQLYDYKIAVDKYIKIFKEVLK